MHQTRKLKNGMTVITVPVAGTKATTILVLVPIGSRYENKKIGGASHFVEHLMFKGTKKRPTSLDISRELDAIGAQYNAFTNKDYTGYWIKTESGKKEIAFDVLSDMLFDSVLDAGEIKKEKGVIIEEIKMYEDNPTMAIDNLLDRLLFGDHPLGRDIAGKKEGIAAVSRADLWNYYKSVYVPKNMVLVIAGHAGADAVKFANKYFGSRKPAAAKISKEKFTKFVWPRVTADPKKRLSAEKRAIDQAHVMIGYPGLKIADSRRYAMSVMLNILGGGMSSRLFVEVREKRGLAYMVRAGSFSHRDTGGVCIQAGLDVKRLGEAFQVINAECAKMAKISVTKKELEDAKNNIAGHMALSMEDSSAQANWFAGKFWFEGKLRTYEEEIKNLRRVKAEEVRRLAGEIFRERERRVAVISPLTKKAIIKIL